MSEYTPSTEDAKQLYGLAAVYYNGNDRGVAEERFDRFLASVKAEAWDEGYDADGYLGMSMNSNPYRTEQV